MIYDYDILFLGGGLNYAGAVTAAKAGLRTALVEKKMVHLGGTCLHNGCIPSKMYLHAAETVLASRKNHFTGKIALDMAKLDAEKEAMLSRATGAITKQCSDVELIDGEGVLTAPYTVKVADRTITAKHIVIGTGSSAFIPEGVDYDGEDVISSDDVLNMKELPEKIAVYGSGAIGLEMASFFAAAGIETELIWRHDRLLRKAHPTISKHLMKQFENLGVTLMGYQTIKTAKKTKRGVHIVFGDGKEHYVPKLLVATGRRANTAAIQTEEVKVGKKGIETDMHFETTLRDHYAVGDCNGKIQLAHAARAEVLYVVRRILGKQREAIRIDNIVKFIHTLPSSYAYVGKIRSQLEDEGVIYHESSVPLGGLPYPHINDADLGLMAVYSDEENFIIGAEIFAPHAEELVAIVAMAIAGEMDATLAKRTILAHPTFSESLEKSFMRL
ncbi:dihydrolipoyl dehydrogenase family protein [Sulfurovum sp. NBC37-1]|uniref:dihydrolipoyl dehydrogenase family protein n=1 Tax=Sulfurovum sp. (strain NBC37-1) TaxID=387093 RepID=UPI00015875C9|nr:NAD(P)/FAD-dependent oxidoreductase [Sulfurovum sp. NBC37-1]BAF72163.1 pyruvate/2-oxoglutarate dehydrogenase complex, E3 component, dihydrolipoamide dehydrogenase [Sulfurovum sp. NBC37-1]